MAEHGGGVVHVKGSEDQGHAFGIQLPEPVVQALAGLFRHAAGIKLQLLLQPFVAGGETALRMILIFFQGCEVDEEIADGGGHFRFQIPFALRVVEKTQSIRFAFVAPPKVFFIVKQEPPVTVLVQFPVHRFLHQGFGIRVTRWLGVGRDRTCQKENHD